jgi:hypothetical protein
MFFENYKGKIGIPKMPEETWGRRENFDANHVK